jgi:hypothetical protein
MKKNVILISISIILSAVLLCGCNEENENNDTFERTFIGKWKVEGLDDLNETWDFLKSGLVRKTTNRDGEPTSITYEWEDRGSELCIKLPNTPEDQRCGTYEFTDNNKSFTWTYLGFGSTFTRVTE